MMKNCGLLICALAAAPCFGADKMDGSLRDAFEKAIYSFDASGQQNFQGSNRAQHLTIDVAPGETTLTHADNAATFRLRGYGYGANLFAPGQAQPVVEANRLEYRRDGMTEWYVNDKRGLEQGFTLTQRPGTSREGEPLVISLGVRGSLDAKLSPAGDAVQLESSRHPVLRYAGLRAWDARGRTLPSHFEVREQEVRLVVKDRDAEYPLVVDPTWVLEATLVGNDTGTSDEFGESVWIDGNTALVGASLQNSKGAAYVFVRSGTTWTQQGPKLVASDGANRDFFGFSVSLSGDTAVIGAPFKNSDAGAAYVFTRSGGTWPQQAELTAPTPTAGDFFGNSVSISGGTIVVGAPGTMVGGNSQQGVAYVFTGAGAVWNLQQTLTGSDSTQFDEFGSAVAINGTTIVVGAPDRFVGENNSQGTAYVFVPSGSSPPWMQQAELIASDGAPFDNFGSAVAVNVDTAIIGAPQRGETGAAYVFFRSGGSWAQQQILTPGDGQSGDQFGAAVAVYGDVAVIGAPNRAGNSTLEGAVYIFGRNGSAWTQLQELFAPDAGPDGVFGNSVSISGTDILVGEPSFVGDAPVIKSRQANSSTHLTKVLAPLGATPAGNKAFVFGILAVPGLMKSFSPNPINVGGMTTLTFMITNPNPMTTLTGVGFNDPLPTGLTYGAVNGTCGGGTIMIAGNTLTLSGATLIGGASCMFSVAVTGNVAGPYNNQTSVLSSSAGNGNFATAPLVVQAPATLTKSFNPPSILVGTTSILTFVVTNPDTTTAQTGVGFTDQLLAGLTYGAVNGTCGAGTVMIAGNTLTLSGGTLAAGGSCTFSVVVNGNVAGSYPNMTSVVTSSEGTSPGASATLAVIAPPGILKVFNPDTITVNGTSTLNFTITNPAANPVSLTGIAFNDPLPAGVVATASVTAACGGTLTVTAGNIALSGGTLAPGGACMFGVQVTGTTAGLKPNSVTVSSTNGGTGNTSMATLTVIGPPQITKAFTPATIPSGAVTVLSFVVTNPNPTVALTGVAFSDTLPPGLSVATPNGLSDSCSGAVNLGVNTITLTPSTLAAGASCGISVNVTGTVPGTYLNTTTPVTSTNGGTGPTASATLVIGITDPFQIRYASNLNIGDSFVNITNTGASSGNICANVYVFDQSEELLACCSCFVTPNGLQSASVKQSLIANNLTPEIPNSVVIKLLATVAGATGASCNASTPTFGTLASGMRAWGTSLHALPTTPVAYGITETPFLTSDLSQGELNHLTSFCGFIQSNASGFGICNGCTVGGKGATTLP